MSTSIEMEQAGQKRSISPANIRKHFAFGPFIQHRLPPAGPFNQAQAMLPGQVTAAAGRLPKCDRCESESGYQAMLWPSLDR
ncbi:hypothetical protein [Noviherbaspirillum massiliense]|uniref:hypothetical protein n=1 Tax=Noviherbaspirillum massiliense TaxID=1465823 RepID=UPI0011DCB50E|nr:hypothetical protein [Noviherbaspirillum massiliense]